MLNEILSQESKEKLIMGLIGLNGKEEKLGDLSDRYVGKVCMFRTYSAGVFFGELVEKKQQQAIVENARRVFCWTQACSLSQLAMEGSKDIDNCKIAMPVSELLLDQVIEVIPMSDLAIKNLSGAKEWKK